MNPPNALQRLLQSSTAQQPAPAPNPMAAQLEHGTYFDVRDRTLATLVKLYQNYNKGDTVLGSQLGKLFLSQTGLTASLILDLDSKSGGTEFRTLRRVKREQYDILTMFAEQILSSCFRSEEEYETLLRGLGMSVLAHQTSVTPAQMADVYRGKPVILILRLMELVNAVPD